MAGSILLILALFIVGLVLVALEAFIIPGFGVTGVVGGLIIIYAAYRAWTDLGPAWGLLVALGATIGSSAFWLWMPRSPMGRRLTLRAEIDAEANYDADARRAGVAVGQRGVTASPLRPSGFAHFGEHRVEVRTGGEWLDRGTEVEIVALKDGKVFVEAAEPPSQPS